MRKRSGVKGTAIPEDADDDNGNFLFHSGSSGGCQAAVAAGPVGIHVIAVEHGADGGTVWVNTAGELVTVPIIDDDGGVAAGWPAAQLWRDPRTRVREPLAGLHPRLVSLICTQALIAWCRS